MDIYDIERFVLGWRPQAVLHPAIVRTVSRKVVEVDPARKANAKFLRASDIRRDGLSKERRKEVSFWEGTSLVLVGSKFKKVLSLQIRAARMESNRFRICRIEMAMSVSSLQRHGGRWRHDIDDGLETASRICPGRAGCGQRRRGDPLRYAWYRLYFAAGKVSTCFASLLA